MSIYGRHCVLPVKKCSAANGFSNTAAAEEGEEEAYKRGVFSKVGNFLKVVVAFSFLLSCGDLEMSCYAAVS
jgi:hypothetical protein